MVENSPNTEASFWQGHHLQDDCPWTLYSTEDDDLVPYEYNRLKDSLNFKDGSRDKRVFDTIHQFWASNRTFRYRRLGPNNLFNVYDYPAGTIVKLSYDEKSRPLFRIKNVHEDNVWGIIIPDEYGKSQSQILIGFTEASLGKALPPDYPQIECAVKTEIGSVEHSRFMPDGFFDHRETVPRLIQKVLRVGETQRLQRINWIEIWRYGGSVEKKARIRTQKPVAIAEMQPFPVD